MPELERLEKEWKFLENFNGQESTDCMVQRFNDIMQRTRISRLCDAANEIAHRRKQNTQESTCWHFIKAIWEEVDELYCELLADPKDEERIIEELADVVITCFSMAGFYKWNLEKKLLQKMYENKKRAERGE